jgi:energy-coupling factor transporter ATP-binding protein EcfA2
MWTDTVLPARKNPFRADRIEALRYRLDDAGWHTLMTRFATQHWRGVLIGPHGSGKTTLREAIERRMRAEGWRVCSVVLGDDRVISWRDVYAVIADADERTVLSLDGLDRLSAWSWWRLTRMTNHLGGLLATSHVPGRLPTLHQHHTSPELLHDLVHDLTNPSMAASLRDRCTDLFQHYRGDVRACLRRLYDETAESPSLHVAQ